MQKSAVLTDLETFISIQSVSADSSRKKEMKKAVTFLQEKLSSLGFELHICGKNDMPPLIVAIKEVPHAKKTIGIYGHYDVQHEEPVDEWSTKPYTLTIKDGKLFGRGVADNKGHVVQNIVAIEELIAQDKLNNNIVFFIEGEEEVGSEYLEGYVVKYKDILSKVDVFLVTDSGMHAKNVPEILYSLRGLVYFEIEVTTGKSDLHSGVYGNAALNPIQVLSRLFTQMKDIETGEVHIPDFYSQVREIDEKEMKLLNKSSVSDKAFQEEMQSYSAQTMRGVPAYLAPKLFPSLDVHGIIGGYTGEGPKTVIPRSAKAKFSCRLVENQEVASTERIVHSFIKKNLPRGVQFDLEMSSYDGPFYTSHEDSYMQKTAAILTDHFGTETVFMREGGSIPAAEILQRKLKKPVVLTGFILPDSNLHAPNENFDEEMFWKGIEALQKIYSYDF